MEEVYPPRSRICSVFVALIVMQPDALAALDVFFLPWKVQCIDSKVQEDLTVCSRVRSNTRFNCHDNTSSLH